MLILFHCLSILIFQLLRNRKRKKFLQSIEAKKTQLDVDAAPNVDLEFNLKFDPPVFRQRYARVYETLMDERWRTNIKKLVDFGCAEFGLFVFIKRLCCLNNITFVDIDETLLSEHRHKLYPLTIEFIKRRQEPLDVNVFAGSVADPDYRLVDTDVVTAVELIEHLYPDILDAFPYNIFNFVKPKLVLITTPNADFNVLFSHDLRRFRHYDHKFEWSRRQFEEWANNIIIRFPDYTVSFSGIGAGPDGTEHLGQCSQMALFVRKDVLHENYSSGSYLPPCLCSSSSPCKGLTADCKLQCKCVCTLCSPSASYGICTYCSFSKQIISYEIEDDRERNPSYNIYYKIIEKIEYPFFDDGRTEDEKMIDELKYRINNMGQTWSRFYMEDRNRSEIPLVELLSCPDAFSITESELDKLLAKFGYQIEECRIERTGLPEKCVIYEPVMEEISSTSEASGYDSDFTKYQLNEESLSDWEDPYVNKENSKPSESSKDISCLDMTSREDPVEVTDVEEEKKQQDSLFDSGYQKSLSLIDDSPQTPLEDLEESDLFEDTTSTPSLSSEDNKVHLKRASTVEKQSFIPVPPDITKFKLDINRINEMDKYHTHNMPPKRTFFDHFVPPPEAVKKNFLRDKDSVPGPSNVQGKKRKKFKKTLSIHSDEDSPLEDVKSITNCIIENTLNKIVVNDEKDEKNDLIEYVAPEPEPEAAQPVVAIEAPPDPPLIVENGDLANNNRDIEGNNYIAEEQAQDHIGNDIANDNLEIFEDAPQIQEENANFDNNNGQMEALQVIEDPPVIVQEMVNVENADNAENMIAQASREALFDPNSEQDLLEDFEIPAPLNEADIFNIVNVGNNIVLIGVHPTPEENEIGLQPVHNGFPNWLLQILGTQATLEDEPPPGSLEEPHFYCQGDGLGVHPSVIAVEIDEGEEEESSDSSNNTTDFAEVDQGLSSQDMSSLPEDSQANAMEVHEGLLETDERAPVTPTTSEQNGYTQSNSSSDVGTNSNT